MKLKKELTPEEIRTLEKAIKSHFVHNTRFDRFGHVVAYKSFKELDEFLGLAYTSGSAYAGLWICNTKIYLDVEARYEYNGFGMTVEGWPVALCVTIVGVNNLVVPL